MTDAGDRRAGFHAGASLAALFALVVLWAHRAPWPDDWDGVGFVLAVRDFDLARFRPHFPGYPAYVALARALRPLCASDALAASAASAVGGALTVWGAASLLRGRAGAHYVALALLASPLFALSATSVGSDALGAGLLGAALACGAQVRGGNGWAVAAGVLAGASLGARPSNAPHVAIAAVACAALWRGRHDLRANRAMALALAGGVLTGSVCAAALLARHPWAELAALGSAQWRGHFGEWGGAATSASSAGDRLAAFARAIGAGTLGADGGALGYARGAAVAALAATGLSALPVRARWAVAISTLASLAFALVAQNVTAPRHALLPACVIAALAGTGLASLARNGARSRAALTMVAAVALVAWPTASRVRVHRRVAPPGLAAARWVRAQSSDAAIFGGRAARFAELERVESLPRTWMGEVDAALERARRIPARVYVTDEVRFRERARGAFELAAVFCRDPRAGRGGGCLTLYRYDVLAGAH